MGRKFSRMSDIYLFYFLQIGSITITQSGIKQLWVSSFEAGDTLQCHSNLDLLSRPKILCCSASPIRQQHYYDVQHPFWKKKTNKSISELSRKNLVELCIDLLPFNIPGRWSAIWATPPADISIYGLKGKATFKTTCFDLILALPYFQNILVKRLTMPPK